MFENCHSLNWLSTKNDGYSHSILKLIQEWLVWDRGQRVMFFNLPKVSSLVMLDVKIDQERGLGGEKEQQARGH